jgi:hypothetical protein
MDVDILWPEKMENENDILVQIKGHCWDSAVHKGAHARRAGECAVAQKKGHQIAGKLLPIKKKTD